MIHYKLDYGTTQKYINMLNEDEQVYIDIFNNRRFDISLSKAGLDNTLCFIKSEKDGTYNCIGYKTIPLFYRRSGSGICPYICAATMNNNIYYAHTLKIIKNEKCTSEIGKEFGIYCEENLLAKGYIDYKERLLGIDILNKEQYTRGDLDTLKFIIFLWVYKCALTRVYRVA